MALSSDDPLFAQTKTQTARPHTIKRNMKARRVVSSTSRLIDTLPLGNYQSATDVAANLFEHDQFEKPNTGFLHSIRMKLKPEYRDHQKNLQRLARELDYARQEAEIELEDKREEQERFDERIRNWNKLSDEQKEAYDAFSRQVSSTGKWICHLKAMNEAIRAGCPVEFYSGNR